MNAESRHVGLAARAAAFLSSQAALGAEAEQEKKHIQVEVWVAIAVDLLVAVSKLVIGLLAEAAHSLADTANQILLLVGITLSDRPADEEHPYGHGKDRVFFDIASLVVTSRAVKHRSQARGLGLAEFCAMCPHSIKDGLSVCWPE